MKITPITVERQALVSSPKGAVMGTVEDHYLQVGELYVSTERKSWGYATALGACGNGVGSQSKYKSAQEVAEYVACPSNYEPMLARCKQLAAPISQSYLDFCKGTEI